MTLENLSSVGKKNLHRLTQGIAAAARDLGEKSGITESDFQSFVENAAVNHKLIDEHLERAKDFRDVLSENLRGLVNAQTSYKLVNPQNATRPENVQKEIDSARNQLVRADHLVEALKEAKVFIDFMKEVEHARVSLPIPRELLRDLQSGVVTRSTMRAFSDLEHQAGKGGWRSDFLRLQNSMKEWSRYRHPDLVEKLKMFLLPGQTDSWSQLISSMAGVTGGSTSLLLLDLESLLGSFPKTRAAVSLAISVLAYVTLRYGSGGKAVLFPSEKTSA